jgi:ornithine decarboxylase
MVVKMLAALGTGFDCASKNEIEQVLNLGVDPSRIIYANPCKQRSFVRYSQKQNVKKMTFDNAEELYKIKALFPDAELVLRILTDDSNSLCQLGLKFGAPLETTGRLLRLAREMDLNVIGVRYVYFRIIVNQLTSTCIESYTYTFIQLSRR